MHKTLFKIAAIFSFTSGASKSQFGSASSSSVDSVVVVCAVVVGVLVVVVVVAVVLPMPGGWVGMQGYGVEEISVSLTGRFKTIQILCF